MQALFSLFTLLILWAAFSFTLSVTLATAVIYVRILLFSRIFSPKFQQGANASQISYLELLTTTPNPGNFSDSIETGTYEKTTLGTLTMSHSSGKRVRHVDTEQGKASEIHKLSTVEIKFLG